MAILHLAYTSRQVRTYTPKSVYIFSQTSGIAVKLDIFRVAITSSFVFDCSTLGHYFLMSGVRQVYYYE